MSHFTIKQVSERLGISQSLVYREIRDGRLKCHCFGRRTYRVGEEDLSEYLAACTHQRTPESAEADRPKNRPGTKENNSGLFRHIDVSRLLARQS